MSNLIPALKAELQELDSALSADARYRRLKSVRELLEMYEQPVTLRPGGMMSGSQPTFLGSAGRSLEAPTSKRGKITAEITSYLKAHGATHRTKILEHLVSKGLMGKEAHPLRALAIYLTEEKTFGNDGDGNWFIKPSSP